MRSLFPATLSIDANAAAVTTHHGVMNPLLTKSMKAVELAYLERFSLHDDSIHLRMLGHSRLFTVAYPNRLQYIINLIQPLWTEGWGDGKESSTDLP